MVGAHRAPGTGSALPALTPSPSQNPAGYGPPSPSPYRRGNGGTDRLGIPPAPHPLGTELLSERQDVNPNIPDSEPKLFVQKVA